MGEEVTVRTTMALLRRLLLYPLLRLLHHPLLCLLHHPPLLPQQLVDCVKITLKFLQLMAGTHLANGLIFGIQRIGARIPSFPPTALSLAKLVAHALIRRVSKCF